METHPLDRRLLGSTNLDLRTKPPHLQVVDIRIDFISPVIDIPGAKMVPNPHRGILRMGTHRAQ